MPQQEQNIPELRFPEFKGEWKKGKIKDFDIQIIDGDRGANYPKSSDFFEQGYCLFLNAKNVTKDGFKFDEVAFISQEKDEAMSKGKLTRSDVVLTTRGSLGHMALYDANIPYENIRINSGMVIIRCKEKTDSSYAYSFFRGERFQREIDRLSFGSAQPQLTVSGIKSLPFSSPLKDEQKKIAAFLGAVDEKIDSLQKKKDLLECYKKGCMQKLFSQEIRFTDDSGKSFPDWEEKSLDEIKSKERHSFTGGPFGSNLKSEEYTERGVRIIQLQNIGDGVFNNDYKIYTSSGKADELKSCIIYPGEIIISKMGDPVARACLIPSDQDERYLMASDGIRLSVDKKKFNVKFVHDSINHKTFRNKALSVSTGSTRKRIGLSELRSLTISAPCFDEQNKIGEFLSVIDDKIALVSEELDKTKTFKKGLLQQMFV